MKEYIVVSKNMLRPGLGGRWTSYLLLEDGSDVGEIKDSGLANLIARLLNEHEAARKTKGEASAEG